MTRTRYGQPLTNTRDSDRSRDRQGAGSLLRQALLLAWAFALHAQAREFASVISPPVSRFVDLHGENALIGSLIVSAFTILLAIYAILRGRAAAVSPALNLMDPESRYYDANYIRPTTR